LPTADIQGRAYLELVLHRSEKILLTSIVVCHVWPKAGRREDSWERKIFGTSPSGASIISGLSTRQHSLIKLEGNHFLSSSNKPVT
jgi:hypothetical protein